MLELYADWCVECKTMEMTTFKDPAVMSTLANTLTLKLDMTDNNHEHKAFLKQFGIFGPPTILFFGPQGGEYKQHRLVGTMNPKDFNDHLNSIPAIGK
jgi:thiol:disulfide interchange protein DsbD